jgi:signal transduction histidine kinase
MEIAQMLSDVGTSDLAHTLDLILDQLASVVAHNSSAILLVDGERLAMVASRGYPTPRQPGPLSFPLGGSPLLTSLLERNQPVVFSGHLDDELFYDVACYGPGCHCINVPLGVHEKTIGLLIVNRRQAAGYSPSESKLLSAFAQQAALSIENVRLYEAARRRVGRLEAASRIARRLTLLQDLDRLLFETVDVIRVQFGFYQAHILLVDSATHKLVLREASGPAAELIKSRGLRLTVGAEGITGWVAAHGEPLLCNDVRHDPRYYAEELLPETKGELAVPLRLRDEVIGVLDVQSDRLGAFHAEDLTALQLIADQVAIAIENARLYQETKGRLEAMRALHDVSLDIVAQLDLTERLNTLLQRAASLVQAEAAALSIYDELTGTIRTIASHNTTRNWVGTEFRPGEGLIGYVVATGEALIVNDYAHWPLASERFTKGRWPVTMAVPLKWRERVIGVLVVLNGPNGHAFTVEDQRLLVSFADLAAIALKNAELYAKVKSFSHTLEVQVAERTRELVEARQQVIEKADQAQMLLSNTVQIQEQERARIARDLHDSVTQLTIGALYELAAVKADLDTRSVKAARVKVDMARDLLKQIEREIRQTIYDLRPTLLVGGNLLPGLQKYAASFQQLLGIPCEVQAVGTPVRLALPVEVAIFRIVQEALHNILTHAHATHAGVLLEFQPAQLSLTVTDDGQGFDPADFDGQAAGRHVGLSSMRERAEEIGAAFNICSQAGQGTQVLLRVRLPR